MIQRVDPSAERFLADLSRVQSQVDRAAREISSGLKISQPSDAPDELANLMRLRADLARNTQIRANLGEVKDESDTAEKSLESATKLMDRAAVLASQGANTAQSAPNRQAMAQEVRGILEQLVGLSRTTIQGRYVFSGDQDQSPSYDVNWNNPNGVDRLLMAVASRQIEDASGVYFTLGQTAQNIFDHRNPDDSLASDNVFAAVNSLRISLENNDQPGIDAALTALHTAGDYLSTQLSFYGSVQNRIAGAQSFADQLQTQLQTALSQTQDADAAQAALELTQGRTHMETALSAEARLPRTSLFDFLG